jgi:uncharacterized membrane protein
MQKPARRSWIFALARWLTLALILRVTATILANYPSYFPPDFSSLFLEGREDHFRGLYRFAFYIHIFAAPFVLLSGTLLLCERLLKPHRRFHAWLGRIHVLAILMLLVPSSLVMSRHAFGGWPSGLSFSLLSLVTAFCAIIGVYRARCRQFAAHRRWMLRCYVLLCSAILLRLISGAASLVGVRDAELAYTIAAWASWMGPLMVYEIVECKK